MLYECIECGTVYPKWAGKCNFCDQWNTLKEQKEIKQKSKVSPDMLNISSVNEVEEKLSKVATDIKEFNRAIGGGLVPGSVILISGDPGIGKSTLLLQICNSKNFQKKIIYISGEESTNQIKLRAKRVNVTNEALFLCSTNNLEIIMQILNNYKQELDLVIIDSIQTIGSENIQGISGSVNQIKYCSQALIEFAKKENIPVIIVGHITKEGVIAGPKILEHSVDTVLYFEGEKNYAFRILRAIKNRFGASDELGIFEFKEEGLKEVDNPSLIFLNQQKQGLTGSIIFPSLEGTRPLMVEMQALVSTSFLQMPRRAVIGWDNNRLPMICAVLEKHCKISLNNKDVYLTVMGGIKVNEPAADLAVILVILSSFLNISIPNSIIAFGEIGLSGEIRNVNHASKRIQEAHKLKCNKIITPKINSDSDTVQITHIKDVLQWIKSLA